MKLHHYISGLSALLCLLTSGAFSAAPTEGLLAHWTFDDAGSDTAVDVTGNGHDAKLMGGATLFNGGLKYGALRTSGKGQGAVFTSTDSEQITIACWVKRVHPERTANPRIVETNGYRMFVSYDEYKMDLVFQQDFKLPDNTQSHRKMEDYPPV